MEIDMVAFDWSGTVIDDRKLVYETFSKILRNQNKDIISFDEWVSFMTENSVDEMFSRFSQSSTELQKEIWESHLSEIVKGGMKSAIYPDSLEIFKYIASKGKPIVIVSAQPADHVNMVAEENGLSNFISRVIGNAYDKSIHLTYLCEELKIKPERTMFIGDMISDIEAARRAGVISAAITRGYHTEKTLLTAKPNIILSNLLELRGIL